jgi:hypothetical protein
MITQLIAWTALPNGHEKDFVKLSVFVSPRLWTDENLPKPELQQFPDLRRWTEKAAHLAFQVTMDSGWQTEVKPDPIALNPDLWESLFNDHTYVRPYEFPDYSGRPIHTFPVGNVVSYLKGIYQNIGVQSPAALPGLPVSQQPNPDLGRLIDDVGDILRSRQEDRDRWIDSLMGEIKVFQPGHLYKNLGFKNMTEQDFYQVNRFYSRKENAEPYLPKPDPSLVPPRPEKPELDFHQALGSLGDHPLTLRKLGIILDLLIPIDEIGPGHGGSMIRVDPIWDTGDPPEAFHLDRSAWTHFILTDDLFLAHPRPASRLHNGLLNLRGINDRLENMEQEFHLLQVDPDGLAMKALDFAGTMQALTIKMDSNEAAIDTQEEVGLPSTQTGGLALVRSGRAFHLHQHFAADQTNNIDLMADNLKLFADDLLRGYRVDIFDDTTGLWNSLCRREGKYIFHNTGLEVSIDDEDDEGYVKSASTTSKDEATSDLYFHEVMFKWNGWSLVAQRPGKTIVREETSPGHIEEVVKPVRNEPETEFRLETAIKAKPSSLPSLRFGRRYRMRVRACDIAGNSLPYTTDEEAEATEPVQFGRYEPIAPPTLVLRSRLTEGESTERMVIRSNYKHSTEEYVLLPDVQAATAGKEYVSYKPGNERHVVPPKTSQLMAELHSAFDAYFTPARFEEGYRVALKEEGTLFHKQIVDIATGNKVDLPDKNQIEIIQAPPNSQGETPDQYVIHAEETLVLPYLPETIGRGVSFRGLPGVAINGTAGIESLALPDQTLILKVPFDLNWPEAIPFRLRLEEHLGHMEGRNCSETLDPPDAPPKWDPDRRLLTVYLPKGQVARVLYSTHPGKDPSGNQDLDQLGIWQWLLETGVDPDWLSEFALAGAHWMISPFRQLVLVHAVQQPLCEPQIQKLSAARNLGDTFARLSGQFYLSVKSTSQLALLAEWEEWADEKSKKGPERVNGEGQAFELRIEEGHPDNLSNKFWERNRHEFGDTRHRLVNYHLVGTTRFRDYFPPEITGDERNITRIGAKFQVRVPNSARPAAPKLVYILPAYRWTDDRSEENVLDPHLWQSLERRRLGNALRIYLERPWYSSGDDEKLGLVLWPNKSGGFNNYVNLVSLMGMDPVRRSNHPAGVLTLDHFTNNDPSSRFGLTLDEVSSPQMGVAAFNVEYNEKRQLWYSDILFNPEMATSYYPFVRLAFVRYQPWSIDHAHLSRVLLADFMQLPPDRTLQIHFRDERTFSLVVSGHATADRASNRMEVTLEGHDPLIPDELGWTPLQIPGKANPQVLKLSPLDLDQYLWRWTGDLTLPANRDSEPMRIVVKEYERYQADPPQTWGERVVYADIVYV